LGIAGNLRSGMSLSYEESISALSPCGQRTVNSRHYRVIFLSRVGDQIVTVGELTVGMMKRMAGEREAPAKFSSVFSHVRCYQTRQAFCATIGCPALQPHAF